MRAIIGLGNPGAAYRLHRHTIGFRVLDALAEQAGLTWQNTPEMARAKYPDKNLILIKPMTGMNVSGAVIPYLKKQGIEAADILVIHDELELPFGTVTLRQGGSARGHNGLRSLIAALGTDTFQRLRFGIGRPEHKEEVPHYVLSAFSEPAAQVTAYINQSVAQIISLL